MSQSHRHVLSAPRRVRTPSILVFQPGLLVNLLVCSLVAALFLLALRFRFGPGPHVDVGETLLAGLLTLSAVLVHELAHVASGILTGRRIERIVLGSTIGVHSSGDTTPLRRAFSIAAGPLAEISTGLLYWWAAGADGAAMITPLGAAGLVVVINGTVNLLPVHPASDGRKLVRFLRLTRRTRNKKLRCTAGECTACSGVAA